MAEYTIGSLCAGVGGLDLAVEDVFDAAPAWFSQYEPGKDGKPDRNQYAARVLAKHWPGVPNLGDLTAIDWTQVEPVDILTAGFPCQDLSLAGKRAGMREGNRSGLWFHIAQAIETLRPPLVVIENVPGILSSEADGDVEPCPWCLGDLGGKRRPLRALGAVLADLARLGFDAEWCRLGAADVGAAHKRDRVFLIAWPADPQGPRLEVRGEGRPGGAAAVQDPDGAARGERRLPAPGQAEGRRARADARGRGGAPAADASGFRCEPGQRHLRQGQPDAQGSSSAPADAEGLGRGKGRSESAGLVGGSDASLGGGEALADSDDAGARPQQDREPHRPETDDEHQKFDAPGRVLDWGTYGPAISRWEHVMGCPAPAPTEPGRTGERLASRFVEWLVGLAAGWVTDVGIPRSAELKCLGNIAMPHQAAYAIRYLMTTAKDIEGATP